MTKRTSKKITSINERLKALFHPPGLTIVFPEKKTLRGHPLTKGEARALLDNRFAGQRAISSSHVKTLMGKMNAGEWEETSQGVVLDIYGRLLDGQHRLEAFLASNLTTLPIIQQLGEAPETFIHLDEGVAKRQFKDLLTIDGFEGTTGVSAMFRMLLAFDAKQHAGEKDVGFVSFGHQTPEIFNSNPRLCLNWCAANQAKIEHVVKKTNTPEARRVLRPSSSIFTGFYLWVGLENMKRADAFFAELIEGTWDMPKARQAKYPVKLLRDAILSFQLDAKARKGKVPDYVIAAILIKAWNAYVAGEQITQLRFTPTLLDKENKKGKKTSLEYWPRRKDAKPVVLS